MNKYFGATTVVGLLDRFKNTVRDLATRADKLNDEFRLKTERERRHREAALAEQGEQSSADTAQAEAALAQRKAAATAGHAQRKARISRAYQASREQALQDVEKQTGHRKYDLQKQVLGAEKNRDTSFATAAAALADFKAALALEQQILAELEGRAQTAFRGYRSFRRSFFSAYEKTAPDFSGDENQMLAELRDLLAKTRDHLHRFGRFLFLHLFKHLLVWLILALGELPLILKHSGVNPASVWTAVVAYTGTVAGLLLLRWLLARRAQPLAATIAAALGRARHLHDAGFRKSDTHYQQEVQRITNEYQNTVKTADQELKKAVAQAGEMRVSCRMETDGRAFRILAANDQRQRKRLEQLEREHAEALEQLTKASVVRVKAAVAASEATEQKLEQDYQGQWKSLEAQWISLVHPIYQSINSASAAAERLFPPWQPSLWANWAPPQQFPQAAKFGRLEVDAEKLTGGLPKDQRLTLPGPSTFQTALCLAFPDQGSIILETANRGHDEAVGALNNVILRLLSVAPAGRLNFTIFDPVGLGQNFAGVMHLADYEEQIINSRIWTQTTQFEQKLADLNEHMEKVIQMYLRNEYSTIAEYNEQAGVIAEKYHFLVVADFPVNFSDVAAKRLLSIAASGARCGVYLLLHWDQRQPLPQDFLPDELRKTSFCVSAGRTGFGLGEKSLPGTELSLDAEPAPDFAIDFIQRVGRSSRDSSRVEVPFAHVAPAEDKLWTEETTYELRVSIGRTGATKLQYLAIGKGTRQHVLIAGKTGSGKSTLFHVIITNLSLWCSPEQVEFYLVDFKKGVEFKCYATRRLPHARVVAIESDREFGLSVLQRVDDELRRRGDLFRTLGVQDLAGYKKAGGTEPLPRSLLLIDEFQEFFVEDDIISQSASMLLDRIVRQGRAFGIHVLLGSQTLGGAYTVARTTLGQMVIRIALQCNEADAYLIMDDTNPAPRLLSRPGEGIYNDMAGALEGNSPFQAVWLPDEVRDHWLAKVRERANQNGRAYPGPIVFEGNAPAEVADNAALSERLRAGTVSPAAAARIWLGAPNSIKGPTEALFRRQTGNNLLLIGQRDEAILAIFSVALVSLAAQYPLGAARFILLDSTPAGSPPRDFLDRIIQAIPHPITLAKQADLPQLMKELSDEMKRRGDDPDPDAAPPVFFLIHGLHKFNRLRYEEDFGFAAADADAPPNPALLLNNLLCEATRLGFHVIASCDSYNSVNRFLSRKALTEFEMRVLFQMSANDSASLIDNPKASTLGLHRALLYNEQEGHLETFRPYALPSGEWIENAARNLARLLGKERLEPATAASPPK
ncbi:Cell divisionFtsK/SpoIIIE [Verrucomicrobia bacterium]|nr:Cell divisionFtsK/SpoIIIE [Verrucomicrobiota bacterium]